MTFIADYFDILGGSELSLAALIESCPYPYKKVQSQHARNDDFIIFGNFFDLRHFNFTNYVIIESDYKYCIHRSPTMHKIVTGAECKCQETERGKRVLDFFCNAKHVFWKSLKQKEIYQNLGLRVDDTIISANFCQSDLTLLKELGKTPKNGKTAIYKSSQRIKNYQPRKDCVELGNLPRNQFLSELAKCSKLYYHPLAEDTAPRLVAEALMLGLEIDVNDFVQSKDEWIGKDLFAYFEEKPKIFWAKVDSILKTNNIKV